MGNKDFVPIDHKSSNKVANWTSNIFFNYFCIEGDPLKGIMSGQDKNDILSTNNINGTIYAQIPMAVYDSVTLKINSVSVSSNTFINGNIPYLNSITYN